MDLRLNQFFAVVRRNKLSSLQAIRVKLDGSSPVIHQVIIRRIDEAGSEPKFKLMPCEDLQRDALFVGIHEEGIVAYRDFAGHAPHRPDQIPLGLVRHKTPPIIGLFTEVSDAHTCIITRPADHALWDIRWREHTSNVLKRINKYENPMFLSSRLHKLLDCHVKKALAVQ